MRAIITGSGNMGRAIRSALEARGDQVVATLGRPGNSAGRSDPTSLAHPEVAFEFSHASSLLENVDYALDAGVRRLVIGTTGWQSEPETTVRLADAIGRASADAVVAPTFSIGAVLFAELAVEAARLFGPLADYDPYVFEWHRRTKADRPSGTALSVAERLLPHLPSKRRARLALDQAAPEPDTLEVVALRAGSSPGMHQVGFDAPGETVEIRITARDRSAYVAGALFAADALLTGQLPCHGLIPFDELVRSRTKGTDR
jgi:4-hydroxy-tetrahydrodipicolinate reductase